MTSRERLLRTFRRQPVDRVPISTYELVGYNPDSFENKAPSYRRLMDKIRADTDCMFMWGWASWADSGLWESRAETTPDGATVTYSRLRTPKGDLTATSKRYADVHTVWQTEHLLKSLEDIDRYLSVVPRLFQLDEDKVKAACEHYAVVQELVGDHGVVMNDDGDPSAYVPGLFDYLPFTMFCLHHRDVILELIDALTGPLLQRYRVVAECGLGDMIRICGPEYYAPPMFPLDYFRDMVMPGATQAIAILKERGMFVRLHCHGCLRAVLPMIVEMGADGIDPCEPPPDGDITLGEIKAAYGDDLILFGGTELRILETAEPEQVDALVKQQMDEAKEGGGFVMMPTAAPIDEPLSPRTERNYFAWIDAGLKYGAY